MKRRNLQLVAFLMMAAMSAGFCAYAQSITPKQDEKKGKWGYVSNSDGKWVVKPKFDEATELKTSPDGQLRGTVTQNGKKGLVDDSGKILGAGVVFEEMTPMQGDAMFVKVKGKTGVSNYSGVYLVKPEADTVERLGNDGWIVTVKGKKGVVSPDGKWLINPIYASVDTSVPDYFIVTAGGKSGLLKRDGSLVLAPKDYTDIKPLNGSYWAIKKGNKTGVMDISTGIVKVKPKYEDAIGVYLNGEVYLLREGNNINIVNKDGKLMSRCEAPGLKNPLITEDPTKNNTLSIDLGGGSKYVYNGLSHTGNYLKEEKERYFQFYKNITRYRNGGIYTGDKFYRTSEGVTDYTTTKKFNGNFFIMVTEDGREDLFNVNSPEKIGEIDKTWPSAETWKSDQSIIKLKSDEYLSMPNGTPIDLITYDDKILGLKDKTTGKFTVFQDMNKGLSSLKERPQKFDDVIFVNHGTDGFIGKIGEDTYYYRYLYPLPGEEGGVLIPESTPMEISKNEDLNFTILMNHKGKMGMKSTVGGNMILDFEYDDISQCLGLNGVH